MRDLLDWKQVFAGALLMLGTRVDGTLRDICLVSFTAIVFLAINRSRHEERSK